MFVDHAYTSYATIKQEENMLCIQRVNATMQVSNGCMKSFLVFGYEQKK